MPKLRARQTSVAGGFRAPQGVQERLDSLRIHPVLTAHPAEARRRASPRGLRRVTSENSC